MNDEVKNEDWYKNQFGHLHYRYAFTARIVNDYNKELTALQMEIDALFKEYLEFKENKDGCTVCEEK